MIAMGATEIRRIAYTAFERADRLLETFRDRERSRTYYRPTFTTLIAIGDCNWDYYTDGARIAALAKPGNSAGDSQFGDLQYFRGHMTRNYSGEILTDAGRALVGEHFAAFWAPEVTA